MNKKLEFSLPSKSKWLRDLKSRVTLNLYKDHCTLVVNSELYRFLTNKVNDNVAKLIALFIVFSMPVKKKGKDKNVDNKNCQEHYGLVDSELVKKIKASNRDIVSLLSQPDIAKMTGAGESTIRNYIAKYNNIAFLTLSAEHKTSYHKYVAHEAKHIETNSYQLLEQFFDGLPAVPRRISHVKFYINYSGLDLEYYLLKCYYNIHNIIYNNITPSTSHPTPLYRSKKISQVGDYQSVGCIFFKHFNNPIYTYGFDEKNTPYPCNWCRHPDPKARFIKGRWYFGNIHNTEKGKKRMDYLEPLGLTHEIDMHNAMFYFMIALLPDTVSKADKETYLKTVKSGKLYDDVVDLYSIKEFNIGPDRSAIKERFQQYRNLPGKRKKQVPEIDSYFQDKFPTIREWMLTQKQLQNRLAWIESDFMSYICEKISAENIRYEWLHDAVYVSDENYARTMEVLQSVMCEFENTFIK